MNQTTNLETRRAAILQEIAALGPMRMGSLSERMLPQRRSDGSVHRRGPYTMYTYKKEGKTLGKHLPTEHDAQLYRRQIETYRRYDQLSRELVTVSQRLADIEAAGANEQSKKNSRK
jgi:hypothetical protein